MTHTEKIAVICEGLRIQNMDRAADDIMTEHRAAMNEMAERISQARAGRAGSAETAKPDSPTSNACEATVRTNQGA